MPRSMLFYHAAELADARIDEIKPSDWTSVSKNDGLMRKLIAAYFMYGSQCFICFQKDYFLEDMTANRHRFCSPLLVNAVWQSDTYVPRQFGHAIANR